METDDRLAIHELLALHGHLVDDGDLDRLDEVFTDDVLYDLSSLGADVLHGVAEVRAAALQLGDTNPLAHLVTNILIAERDGQVIARSKFLGVRRDGSVGSGVYVDRLRHATDGWRISHRRVSLRRKPLQP